MPTLFVLCMIFFAFGWVLLAVISGEFKEHNEIQIVLGIICGLAYGVFCIYTMICIAAERSIISDYQFWFCLGMLITFTMMDIMWLAKGRKCRCADFFILSLIMMLIASVIVIAVMIVAMHIS